VTHREQDTGLLSPVWVGTPIEPVVSDRAYLAALLEAEAALARAQAKLGVLPGSAAAAISRAADADRLDVRAIAIAARETANPVVALIAALTREVAALDESAAEYVHRGSTSQDIMDTGEMLVCARALRLIRADLAATAGALADLAATHRDTAMAGRTLGQHAVPTTFGLKAAGWRHLVMDADERLKSALDTLPVSLGGAAGTLGGYVAFARIDRPDVDPQRYPEELTAAYAAETGLAVPALPWHTLRTPIAGLGAALAFTTGALGKIAVDVQTLARTEIAELSEPPVAGRGVSSAMPHKRNPVLATLIRSAALQVPVLATVLTQALIAEDERSAGGWQAEWQPLRECLRLTGGAAHTAAELAAGLRVRPSRMAANLDLTDGQVVAERIAAALTPKLGRAAARRLLSAATDEARSSGQPLRAVLAKYGEAGAADLDELCDPARYTGAAGSLVDSAVGRSRTG